MTSRRTPRGLAGGMPTGTWAEVSFFSLPLRPLQYRYIAQSDNPVKRCKPVIHGPSTRTFRRFWETSAMGQLANAVSPANCPIRASVRQETEAPGRNP